LVPVLLKEECSFTQVGFNIGYGSNTELPGSIGPYTCCVLSVVTRGDLENIRLQLPADAALRTACGKSLTWGINLKFLALQGLVCTDSHNIT